MRHWIDSNPSVVGLAPFKKFHCRECERKQERGFFKKTKKGEERSFLGSLYLVCGFSRLHLVALFSPLKSKESFALLSDGCRSHIVAEPRISCVLIDHDVFLSLLLWWFDHCSFSCIPTSIWLEIKLFPKCLYKFYNNT